MDQEIVISGISGKFPLSNDMNSFRENLFNGVDMVTGDKRWELHHYEMPERMGSVSGIENFDAGFFGIHRREANIMEPMYRGLMEKVFEAIYDAGINPKELEGSKTGVYLAVNNSDYQGQMLSHDMGRECFAFMGLVRGVLPNKISYTLKLNGPSFVVDTGCSSSLVALSKAFEDMQIGKTEAAIVGAAVVHLHPAFTSMFYKIGALSPDGASKSFDDSANGYARSEAICAILLQKSKDARRVYSNIIHCRASSDGFKDTGIVHASSDEQAKQMADFYKECGINPTSIDYVEAHGTGTQVGDFQEVKAISETFCKNRKKPLLLGSVKSNMGHAEAAAGLCQIAKATIMMENGLIPPNLHFKTPRKGLDALEDGRIQVVCEAKPFPGMLAISSFGVGGSNAHTLMKWNEKAKSDVVIQEDDALRLVCVSGRVKESVEAIFKQLEYSDVEFEALLHQVFKYDIPQHRYRGFAIVSKSGEIYKTVVRNHSTNTDFYLTFGNPHEVFIKYLTEILELSVAREIFDRVLVVLTQQGLRTSKELSAVLSTVSVQIIILEVLRLCKLTPKLMRGVGYGQFVKQFALGFLTLEETISAVYIESLNGNKIATNDNAIEELIGVTLHLPSNKNFIFLPNNQENFLLSFLKAIGRLYELGHSPQIYEIFPKINFPVSRGTLMISPLIRWNHKDDYYVPSYAKAIKEKGSFEKVFVINVNDGEWMFIVDHVIDGEKRNLFPGAGYLYIVWETFAAMKGKTPEETDVIFENVCFKRATTIPKSGKVEFFVFIVKRSGLFEVFESNGCVASGKITSGNSHYSEIVVASTEPLDENVIEEKDIYKELKIRGYNYSGLFKSIKYCTSDFRRAEIQWNGNWISFLDSMLQLQVLNLPRALFVVTFIRKIIISANCHLKFAKKQKYTCIPVFYCKAALIIKSGGIEITGVNASAISRRKLLKEPVLEKYVFVPNEGVLSLEEAVRTNVQLITENTYKVKIKFAEIEQDGIQPLTPLILKALSEQIVIQAEEGLIVQNHRKAKINDCLFVVGFNLLQNKRFLKDFVGTDNFVLSREPLNYKYHDNSMETLSMYTTPAETLMLLRKRLAWKLPKTFQLKSPQWIQKLQQLKRNEHELLVFSQNDPLSGILGFANCLRKEPGGEAIKFLLIQDDQAPVVDLNLEFYRRQLRKGLAINVLKNGQWGTYRYLRLEQPLAAEGKHALVEVLSKGNLSSLKWVEGPLTTEDGCVRVYYAALNFKDIVEACGRIQYTTSDGMYEGDLLPGLEYSGIDANERRVMGILTAGALSTRVKPDIDLLLPVPDEWTLEEAVTVPIVYLTALYALVMVAKIKKGQSILIHAGAGGVGQAAIKIAFYYGLKIYTTVGSEQKKGFLLSNYPFLKEHLISNSRNTDFERMVMRETQGRGVDMVLNSLAEEKLEASLRCLTNRGKFLEIGKFDMLNDNNLWLECFKREVSFHGIAMEKFIYGDSQRKRSLINLLKKAMKEGVVKPLPRTLFGTEEIEEAFRFMANGSHIGKVIIKVKEEGNITKPLTAIQRYYCMPEGCCIVTGGLGGFGLELINWLIKRGGRKFVLSSRNGIKNSYQASRIKLTWLNDGVEIRISKHDITTVTGCKELLEEANLLGPVTSIFHLAVVLLMALFEDHTVDTFNECLGPKAEAAKHLDMLSRDLCPNLRDFVVFSSLCCGRGGAGQTSYAMGNSIAERICEQRRKLGLPGLAIQWGMIGDVGLFAEMHSRSAPLEIFGTQEQSISSCLEVLDRFLKERELPIVSSIIMAERKSASGRADNIVEVVANIIGVRDIKTISMHATLPELGMDSLLAAEIILVMDKEFDISFTKEEVRNLTFSGLYEIMKKKAADEFQDTENAKACKNLDTYEVLCVPASEMKHEEEHSVYLLAEVEGVWDDFVNGLPLHCFGLLFKRENLKETDVEEIASKLLNLVEDEILRVGTFSFVAQSFGCLVALETTSRLEKQGVRGKVILIHGELKTTFNLAKQQKGLSQLSTTEFRDDLFLSFFQRKVNNSNSKRFSKIRSNVVLCKPNEQSLAESSEINSLSEFIGDVKVCRVVRDNFNGMKLFNAIREELLC